jgi:ElaB/YqjD/DUF883 family membrane-anchored ribosome-binding protein
MADILSGGSNGEQARVETQKAGEHLKSAGRAAADAGRAAADAGRAAGDTLRDNTSAAAEAARSRYRDASDWAQARFHDLQGRVEERPQSAAVWALGIGIVTGFLLGALIRGGHD